MYETNNDVAAKDGGKNHTKLYLVAGITGAVLLFIWFMVWMIGSSNPETHAGYVGYLTQGSVFGQAKFYGVQTGHTSSGMTWLLKVRNVSITPTTYTESFNGDAAVLSKDNLKIQFQVHLVWKVKTSGVKEFIEKYSTLEEKKEDVADKIIEVAYDNFLKEPLRTYARDEVQKLNGLEIKDQITPAGEAIFARVKQLAQNTPFEITSVVVGSIQYPGEVADAVAQKMAATQIIGRKQLEIQQEEMDAKKRVVEAEGIAKAMEIINQRLTTNYLQHEAIEAQKAMVGSPNHTTIYLPVGPMGVPIVGTMNLAKQQ